jgi:hypothetical protein
MIISDKVIPTRLLLFVLILIWGCQFVNTESSVEVQERERFINAYVDWRVSSLRMQTSEIGEAARDSLLAVYDMTEDDLVDFVEEHGADVAFMRDVWNDIETRIATRREGDVGDVR